MYLSKNKIISLTAFVVSIPFQLVSSQTLIIASVFFLIFLGGDILYILVTKEKKSILLRDPILLALASFLVGTSSVTLLSLASTTSYDNRSSSERNAILADYVAQLITCDLAINQFEEKNIEPSYEWLDSMGIVDDKSIYDLILGMYYNDHTHHNHLDYQKARYYFEKAANDNPYAKYLYGHYLYMGIGDISEESRGIDTITKAAEMGVLDAQFKLLGLSAAKNNIDEAEKWYSYIINATIEDSLIVYFNPNLINEPDDIIKQAINNNVENIFLTINEALCLMCDIQIKEKKPYAAIKLCNDYFKILSRRSGKEYDKEIDKLIAGIKYYVFIETGNITQAIKIAHKRSFKSIVPSRRDFEVVLPIFPVNVSFQKK